MVRTSQRQKTLIEVSELFEVSQMDEDDDFLFQEVLGEHVSPSIGDNLFEDDPETGDLIDILFNEAGEARELLEILEGLRYHDPRWKMPFEMTFSLNDLLRHREVEF